MHDQMLKSALGYADKGWPIFPARADKTPYTSGAVLDATTDKRQIEEWWARWPTANIALDVGGAGMMVLDLDPGFSLAELEVNIGKLPKTQLEAATPRGGRHLYYALGKDEIVPGSQSRLAPHVDVRSFHTYVLLPPGATAAGRYTWVGEGKPAHRSDEMLRLACIGSREKSTDRDKWLIEPDQPDNVALAVAWLKTEAKIAVEGLGGDGLAYATAAHMKSFGISEPLAFDLLWEHWNPRCIPPWSADEVEHLLAKVENGYRYNTSPPGNITPGYQIARTKALFQLVATSLPPGEGVEYGNGRFRFIDRVGIEHIKPPEWLIQDLLPEDAFLLLFGAWGTFKTFLALDMALTVATGFPAHSPWPAVARTGPVLFAAGEGRAGIAKRIRAWEKTHWDGELVTDFILADPVPLIREKWEPFIEGALKHNPNGYRLVVLDTVGQAMQGANENAQEDASMFTALTQALRKQLGASVIALHHIGHEKKDRAKGSTEFTNAADTAVRVENEKGSHFVTLHMVKQKDAPLWDKPMRLKIEKVVMGKTDSLVVRPVPASPSVIEPSAELSPPSQGEQAIVMGVLDRELAKVLQSNPERAWSQRELATALAASENVRISSSHLRQVLLTTLREQHGLAAHRCFDALAPRSAGGPWKWRPPARN